MADLGGHAGRPLYYRLRLTWSDREALLYAADPCAAGHSGEMGRNLSMLVLHRDDRLRREILQQRDLLVGSWSAAAFWAPRREVFTRATAAE
jgi:hypothetical protein